MVFHIDHPQSQLDSYLRNESHSQAGLARGSEKITPGTKCDHILISPPLQNYRHSVDNTVQILSRCTVVYPVENRGPSECFFTRVPSTEKVTRGTPSLLQSLS